MWKSLRNFGKWLVEGFPSTHGNNADLNKPIVFPPEAQLWEREEFRPWRLKHGVEILNDNVTPFEFAWDVMTKDFQMPNATAAASVMKIHRSRGLVVKTKTRNEADEIVKRVKARLKETNYPLVVRAFTVPDA